MYSQTNCINFCLALPQHAPASLVAPIDKLSVVFAIFLGVTVLGEPLTWKLAAGGALIVAGALVIASS